MLRRRLSATAGDSRLVVVVVVVPTPPPPLLPLFAAQEDSTADEEARANLEAISIAERYRDVALENEARRPGGDLLLLLFRTL